MTVDHVKDSLSERRVSCVRSAACTNTYQISLAEVVDIIRGPLHHEHIAAGRKTYDETLAQRDDRKNAKKECNALKKRLTGILFSGTFERRASEALEDYSGLLCADIDDDQVMGETLGARRALEASPHCVACFLSPTGQGVKAVFRVGDDPAMHNAYFLAVKRHIRDRTGLAIDERCKDVARLCFVSHDPQTYFNPEATALRKGTAHLFIRGPA